MGRRAPRGARDVLALKTVSIGAPGNPSVAVVPFTDAIYQSCADAPSGSKGLSHGRAGAFRYVTFRVAVSSSRWRPITPPTWPLRAGARRACSRERTVSRSTRSALIRSLMPRPSRAASAPSARPRPRRRGAPLIRGQRGRVDRRDHPVADRQERRPRLAAPARRHRQRRRLSALALGRGPPAPGQRTLHRQSAPQPQGRVAPARSRRPRLRLRPAGVARRWAKVHRA
jgi:hypothetical protein